MDTINANHTGNRLTDLTTFKLKTHVHPKIPLINERTKHSQS